MVFTTKDMSGALFNTLEFSTRTNLSVIYKNYHHIIKRNLKFIIRRRTTNF